MSKPASQQGGFRKKEVKEFEEEVVQIDRVTRVVKGGRKMRFRATVVVGNRRGKVGIGIGKSVEVTGAIQKGIAQAKKDMLDVKMDGSTIPHDIKIKFKAARILLMPAVPGTGLIAGGTVRKVLELAGVKDILSKCFGTTNKVNNTKATFKALQLLKETPGMAKRKLKKATDRAAQDAARAAAAAAPKAPEKKAEDHAKPVETPKAEAHHAKAPHAPEKKHETK